MAEYSTQVESAEDAKVAYLTADHLGSPRINTDRDGNVTSRRDFMPYGEQIFTAQRTTGLGYDADTIRKQFTGYERDTETDLDFAEARMYTNSLGRYYSADEPFADQDEFQPQSWNIFVYARNNPLKDVDLSGNEIYYASEQIRAASDDLRLKSATYDNAPKAFEGKDAPNLTLQIGDAGMDANGVDKAIGLTNAAIRPDRTIEDGSKMDANDPDAKPEIIKKPAEFVSATITIDTSIVSNPAKVAETLAHEVGHANHARRKPQEYHENSQKTKAERGKTPHDQRPNEKIANQFEKTVMSEKKAYEKAEKERLKAEEKRRKEEQKRRKPQE